MIELKENQIIQTRSGTNYVLNHVLLDSGGVTAKTEDGYEYFIYFKDFKVVFDPNTKDGGTDELCRTN